MLNQISIQRGFQTNSRLHNGQFLRFAGSVSNSITGNCFFFAITGFCRLLVFTGFTGLNQTGRDLKPSIVGPVRRRFCKFFDPVTGRQKNRSWLEVLIAIGRVQYYNTNQQTNSYKSLTITKDFIIIYNIDSIYFEFFRTKNNI